MAFETPYANHERAANQSAGLSPSEVYAQQFRKGNRCLSVVAPFKNRANELKGHFELSEFNK
jgi:hypothetical protein